MLQEEGEVHATIDNLVHDLNPPSPSAPPPASAYDFVPTSSLEAGSASESGQPSAGAGPSSAPVPPAPEKAFKHSSIVVTVGGCSM